MTDIPKYAATAESGEEEIIWCGTGDTPEEALKAFTAQPILDYSQENSILDGEEIEVNIWTIEPLAGGWPPEQIEPHWKWCLKDFIETRTVVLQKA